MAQERYSFMKKNKIEFFLQRNLWLLLTISISLLPLISLLHNGMFVGHDTQDHVARIANFYQNLKEGTLIPRWAGNLNWGYGHPILMFLYPLPSYIASLFIVLGFSVVDATKLVFATGFVCSGLAMYFWIRKIWNERMGFIAAALYLFAPYRFVDLYVRGAIGENFFFIFPPVTCYFLLRLIETKKIRYISFTALGVAGMILSHNALAIMFLPFVVIYALLLLYLYKEKITAAVSSIAALLLGFGLSAFFLLPAFLEGKYTLRDIVTKNEIFNRFETFSRLIYSTWSYGGTGQLSVQVGVLHWLVVIGSSIVLFIYFFTKQKTKKLSMSNFPNQPLLLAISSLVFFFTSIVLILPTSKPIYMIITTLQKFQFPWRFLSLSVFTSAILGAFFIAAFSIKRNSVIIAIGIFIILVTIPFWQPKDFTEKAEEFYTDVYSGTTDTGESAPVWSVRFMEKQATATAQIVEGSGQIDTGLRTNVKHTYTIETTSDNTRVLENTLYFPGWKVFVDSVEVPFSELFFQDPNYRGVINFYIPSSGKHEVVVAFTETKLRLLSNIISALSIVAVVGLLVYGKK